MAVQIFDIQMRGLNEILKKQQIILNITDDARHHLAIMDFTPKYGARQISSVIRQQIRRPVSKMIVAGEVEKEVK